jgi:hypothetical protein
MNVDDHWEKEMESWEGKNPEAETDHYDRLFLNQCVINSLTVFTFREIQQWLYGFSRLRLVKADSEAQTRAGLGVLKFETSTAYISNETLVRHNIDTRDFNYAAEKSPESQDRFCFYQRYDFVVNDRAWISLTDSQLKAYLNEARDTMMWRHMRGRSHVVQYSSESLPPHPIGRIAERIGSNRKSQLALALESYLRVTESRVYPKYKVDSQGREDMRDYIMYQRDYFMNPKECRKPTFHGGDVYSVRYTLSVHANFKKQISEECACIFGRYFDLHVWSKMT